MIRHPAALLILNESDIEWALKQYIYTEYPEYKTNHNIWIETNLKNIQVKAVCCTPIKEENKDDS